MLTIILISFFSGVLTVLAPCVLPLLPVILGGSLAGQSRWRPMIIIGSLIFSLLVFTVILKASTILIDIDPSFWEYVSGGLLVVFALTLIFPGLWVWIMRVTGIEHVAQQNLESANQQEGIWSPIALGAALGPVFSSCNPTYTVLLATILPVSIGRGLLGLFFYFLGLGLVLLLIVRFGRSILGRFRFFTNPSGWFRRGLGILILIVGLLVLTGYIKKIETAIIEKNIFINTATIDHTLNDIVLRAHNTQGDACSDGSCDTNRGDSALQMDLAKAPELVGDTWINSDPLTMEGLRGQVVLIDFWTYSCINCIRTQPYLNAWYEKYRDEGLVIVGVHAPEFAFEKIERNVREASQKAGIQYPILLDNDFATWNAYSNRYWPAKYLIDQNGNIVYKHFGEGKYEETEEKIQSLLKKNSDRAPLSRGELKGGFESESETPRSSTTPLDRGAALTKTPETYLGSDRGEMIQRENFVVGPNAWQAFGTWKQESEYIESTPESEELQLNFTAKHVYLVVSGGTGVLEVQLYGQFSDKRTVRLVPVETKRIDVTRDDIYEVVNAPEVGDYTLQITASSGLRLHAFTFGS